MASRDWHSDIVRGLLSLVALSLLAHEQMHGYRLLARIRERARSLQGRHRLPDATGSSRYALMVLGAVLTIVVWVALRAAGENGVEPFPSMGPFAPLPALLLAAGVAVEFRAVPAARSGVTRGTGDAVGDIVDGGERSCCIDSRMPSARC